MLTHLLAMMGGAVVGLLTAAVLSAGARADAEAEIREVRRERDQWKAMAGAWRRLARREGHVGTGRPAARQALGLVSEPPR